MADAAERLEHVLSAIGSAEAEAGRDKGSVHLIAVSKTFGPEAIEPVLAAGQRLFGENRVQEAVAKWPGLLQLYPDASVHLIGPLQTNKAKDAVALFDAVHSLDRERLAAALAKEFDKQDRRPELFVEVNTGEEEQKAGVSPKQTAGFVETCRTQYGLEISGLMCIPPLEDAPGPHFALLAKIASECGLKNLSMGMSADFETAIAFGATHVRIGTAVFGPRN